MSLATPTPALLEVNPLLPTPSHRRILSHLLHLLDIAIAKPLIQNAELSTQPRVLDRHELIPKTAVGFGSMLVPRRLVRPQPLLVVHTHHRLGHLRRRSGRIRPVIQLLNQLLDLKEPRVGLGGQRRMRRARAAVALEPPVVLEAAHAVRAHLLAVDVGDGDLLARHDGAQRVHVVRQRVLVEEVGGVGAAVVVQHCDFRQDGGLGLVVDEDFEVVGVDPVVDGVAFEVAQETPEELLRGFGEGFDAPVQQVDALAFDEFVGFWVGEEERGGGKDLVAAEEGFICDESAAFGEGFVLDEWGVRVVVGAGD